MVSGSRRWLSRYLTLSDMLTMMMHRPRRRNGNLVYGARVNGYGLYSYSRWFAHRTGCQQDDLQQLHPQQQGCGATEAGGPAAHGDNLMG